MTRLDRRTFLVGSATLALATACGGGDDAESSPQPGSGDASAIAFLVPSFPDGYRSPATLVAGLENRITFVVRDQETVMRSNAPSELAFSITQGESDIIYEETVAARADGIITPYFPLRFTPAVAGEYVARLVDHPDVDPIPFVVTDKDAVAIPQVGDTVPIVATPTVDDDLGVTPICTRAVPCPFHDHSFDTVFDNGRPTVLLIATPGFCQTDICGPVVDLLIDASEGRDGIDYVHAEVYVDPSDFDEGTFPDTTDAVAAMGLPYEPALFAMDAEGTLMARLDTTWDRSELDEALSTLS